MSFSHVPSLSVSSQSFSGGAAYAPPPPAVQQHAPPINNAIRPTNASYTPPPPPPSQGSLSHSPSFSAASTSASTQFHTHQAHQTAQNEQSAPQLVHSFSAMAIRPFVAPHPQPQPGYLVEKSLPALPPTSHVLGTTFNKDIQSGQEAAGSRFLAPLQLNSQQSFADELGSYLSEQEASQQPPPLKDALLNLSTSKPASPPATQPYELTGPAFTTLSTLVSSPPPPSNPVDSSTFGSTTSSLSHQSSVTNSVVSNSTFNRTDSTTSSKAPSLPRLSNESGEGAPTFVSQSAYHPQQQQIYLQQQQQLQQQAYSSHPGSNVSSYVPQTVYGAQPTQPPLQQPYQQQQMSSHTRHASYPLPPPVVSVSNSTTTSPSFLPTIGGRAPSPLGFSTASDRAPTASRLSSSSDESRDPHRHQHTRAASQGNAGVTSGRASPLFINSNGNTNDYLKPVPAKSEDWAALVDAPLSPTFHYPSNGMRPYQGQGQFMGGSPGYTDSPAEDATPSGDYMQARQSITGPRPYPSAQTDPTSMRHRHIHQQHQQHNSMSSVPSFAGNTGPAGNSAQVNSASISTANDRQQHRKSWSPNTIEPLESGGAAANGGYQPTYGFHTPPRRNNGSPAPRSGAHSKQNSVATSVSLLNNTAIVAKYREAAIKTNDTSLQLSYAKYLLEIGEPSPVPNTTEPPASSSNGSPTEAAAATGRASTSSSPTPGQQDGSEGAATGKKQLTQEAIYWIDRLAKEGQPEAQFIRGTWYEDGLYWTKKTPDKALRLYQSASKGDYAPAHYKVAFFCEKRKDNNKAVVLYKKAATHNDVPSNHRLAIIYLYGELGQTKNMKTGLQYLKRAAANATESCPMSPYVLGLILAREYKQLSIPDDIAFPDDGEALEWFRKSAELGYGPANYKLGYCYEYGTLHSPIDPFLSTQHYERAVLAGDSNGEAEMALSGWYLSGAENCFEADDTLAFKYAAKAAEKQLPKAQYAMGYYHEVGISVPIDMDKAMEFYRLAAANGNKDAQARLTERSGKFDKSGHKQSIRRIKQGRHAKDQSCSVM
ncbi:hypothetical protein KVV02_003322 [Mortierella alpina]|uniref:Uncharacterized protein n=1 Tax=Mortierella alpina TaxID=64518 RepID=A0A9P8CUQ5_MORAP|nr:hypothetical protein KVV02_003322 [Mortierella alpina]